jgi:glutathione synthase/RimK-type ligase-like ATP-grasp enzyme
MAALRCGLKIPATLVSNEPTEILSFARAAPGLVIYKTFNGLVPTTVVTEEMLSELEILRWTPGIYQHYIEKDHEVRATVVGRRFFVVRIRSQETMRGRIDWREAQRSPGGRPSDLVIEPAALPPRVEQRCRRLLRSLGLAYAAIDLIVTPQGDYVFLEVNSSGQFLWVDAQVNLPVLDALAAMLIQGRIDYEWDSRSVVARFDAAFEQAVTAREEEALAEHNCEIQW